MRLLFVVGDRLGWSIDDDRARLRATARRLGVPVGWNPLLRVLRAQPVFQHNHFSALHPRWLESSQRLGLSYFHGRPATPGYPEFDRAYAALRDNVAQVERIQVTHDEMHELVLAAGVDERKVFRIPIGIDLERFALGDDATRSAARASLDIPESAFVVGSFQKDGVGFGDGLEPKSIKGPDVLVAVLEQIRAAELFVLLTGPARGYVRRELERAGIPHRHVQLPRDGLATAYHALDAYLVTSRQEGGPKSVLEALATGVPLVTTRVGQVPELLVDGEHALLAGVDDTEELVGALQRVHDDAELRRRLRSDGRPLAEAYAEERLDARWAELLEGFAGHVD
ncbi:MAG: glycosyltransferase family 4 protein [Gaiellaceae bacterium]